MYLFSNFSKAHSTAACLILAAALMSCNKDKNIQTPTTSTTYGSYVKIGDGQARTFIVKDPDGRIKSMGFSFTEAGLTGLPQQNTSFVLPMPAGNQTLVDHISLDFSPLGHAPSGIYGVPQFDAHFYMISAQEQGDISLNDPRIDIVPPAGVMPKNYVPLANENKAGKRWIDTTAVEYHGKTFTESFAYGTYNGKVISYEPMLSVEYVKTKPNETFAIKQQEAVQQSGLYPQQFTIQWQKDRQEYVITMDQLTSRQQN